VVGEGRAASLGGGGVEVARTYNTARVSRPSRTVEPHPRTAHRSGVIELFFRADFVNLRAMTL